MKSTVWKLAALGLVFATPAVAGPFEDAMTALGARDFSAARTGFERLANSGNVEAMYHYAVMIRDGEGGAGPDPAASIVWFQRAADANLPFAIYNLGTMHREGRGVARDEVAARRYFLRAAEMGHTQAMGNYGMMLANGHGGAADPVAAQMWLRRARDYDVVRIREVMAAQVLARRIPPPPDAAELARMIAAAEGSDAETQLLLGTMYLYGDGVAPDRNQARRWWLAAAQQGNAVAQRRMGQTYKDGFGITANQTTANLWFRRAAAQGDSFALTLYGAAMVGGIGTERDRVRGMALIILGFWRGDLAASNTRLQTMRTLDDSELTASAALAARCRAEGIAGCGIIPTGN